MHLFSLIKNDIRCKAKQFYDADHWRAMLKTVVTDGTMSMILYRLMQWSRRWRLFPLEMIFNKLNAVCCNCIIGRGAEFGPGFVLFHSTGVVINGKVRGGTNVHLYHQVTLGEDRGGAPTLGNDVLIGAGAKIFGPRILGDGARVGANAVVMEDVPAHSTVVGIPARVVRRRDSKAVAETAEAEAAEPSERRR
jgi:serine O-acetyltransferase